MGVVNIRVDDDLKRKAEKIFEELGLGMTSALTIYLKAVVRNNGIPFSLEIPNEETLKAFKEVEDISSGKKKAKRYSSTKDLRKDLNVWNTTLSLPTHVKKTLKKLASKEKISIYYLK